MTNNTRHPAAAIHVTPRPRRRHNHPVPGSPSSPEAEHATAQAGAFGVTVVGIGEDGWDGLADAAREALAGADVVLGGARQLALVAGWVRATEAWPRDLAAAAAALPDTHAGRRLVVLASGDPMHYGVGGTLTRVLGPGRVRVLPAPSSISLACARLGWPVEGVTVVSTLGRPYAAIGPELRADARVLVLTGDEDGADRVRRLVTERGLGADLTVLERLGGPHERVRVHPAGPAALPRHDRLAIVAVRCAPGEHRAVASQVPGLPDETFATDGVLTKQEVRAITLAALAPAPGELLWDVGAGSGGITTEWLRADLRCRVVAIEPRADRAAHVRANAERLAGVVASPAGAAAGAAAGRLRIVEGRAPDVLAGLPTPDAVFVGGGASIPGVIDACLAVLPPGGRLVVNAVTIETEAVLVDWHRRAGGRLRRIAISHAEPVGSFTAFRAALPVTQWVHTTRSEPVIPTG
ncbi:bifunctional cobalt-precorrin-7 (C(5))-methyltransferase/cobalt-precorrin-6B (C(15))-methyltransferase [Parafrankia sp. EUN1f]|uniref:bifunctional cobalt-precorrin-7 (C(5))-methyltransferase/cobalt-precorrin-6B (C(15))-methyltransferase n=1 Tax=Parafrankia sp. EUN1f TaxID=102897 RepID=UPI0001C4431F|nr:bifunctional cobalt-precorrin-7 (C(5))-methyltransferase/cobalt-precorrin-6B (C(15))-methyltransferase [Parafrankia sp. EUN1f]EFC84187.1 precorrin-6y C5,15-methyltransferase (decarboxylating), CbiE subunit [Parafrankia sp. EUN1f]